MNYFCNQKVVKTQNWALIGESSKLSRPVYSIVVASPARVWEPLCPKGVTFCYPLGVAPVRIWKLNSIQNWVQWQGVKTQNWALIGKSPKLDSSIVRLYSAQNWARMGTTKKSLWLSAITGSISRARMGTVEFSDRRNSSIRNFIAAPARVWEPACHQGCHISLPPLSSPARARMGTRGSFDEQRNLHSIISARAREVPY